MVEKDLLTRIADRAVALEHGEHTTMLEYAQVMWCMGELRKAIEEIEKFGQYCREPDCSRCRDIQAILKILRGEHNQSN